MKGKGLWLAASVIAVFAIAAGYSVSAQDRDDHDSPIHYRGVINDYPVSTSSTGATTGPWELRGPWSLELKPRSGSANFSAALTMELSDFGAGSVAVATDARRQHTHHITMKAATLIQSPPQSDCPTGITPYPTYTWLLEVTGMADVTGNGGSPFGVPVPLQVCLGGGPNLQVSNITLVFTNLSSGNPSLATYHFGPQAIHGVVRTEK
jgi:hypothetical protein